MKKFIDVRVVGNSTELVEFLRICRLIQSFGTYGMSRKIIVDIDGDGSGHLRFGVVNGDGKVEDMPPIDHKELDAQGKEGWRMSIGE